MAIIANSIVLFYLEIEEMGAILLWIHERGTILVKISVLKGRGLSLRI